MSLCSKCCSERAEVHLAFSDRKFCTSCFLSFVEKKVKKTVNAYGMIEKGDRVGVAISGGKDSVGLAYILRRLFPNLDMTAIHVDLGIPDYSGYCRRLVEEFAEKMGIRLVTFDLKKELGFSVADFKRTPHGEKMCASCGVIKRYLINKMALELGVNKLATGHNLDDIVETLLDHYLQGRVYAMLRLRPLSTAEHPKLVGRIKPLFKMTDREMFFYSELAGLNIRSKSCPFSEASRVRRRKRTLDAVTVSIPKFKHLFLKSHYERILPLLERARAVDVELHDCPSCEMPVSKQGIECRFCKLVKEMKCNATSAAR